MIDTKDWVGQVSIPIRSDIDGPIIGHVVELYPEGMGKCVMVDTMKLFHGVASLNQCLEYRLLVEGSDSVPTITVEGSPGSPTQYSNPKLVRHPHDTNISA